MIKIIEKGTRQKKQCDNCGCIFSFDGEDIEVPTSRGETLTKIIHCPQCNAKIELESIK